MAKLSSTDRLNRRLAHLRRLGDADSGVIVDQANESLTNIHTASGKPLSVLVRRDFIARRVPQFGLSDRDRADRHKPPMATIVRSRGIALRLELTLLFLAQTMAKHPHRVPLPVESDPENTASIGLVDLFATGTRIAERSKLRRSRQTMRAMQVQNGLNLLAKTGLELVTLSEGPGRAGYEKIVLNYESGRPELKDVSRYTVPSPSSKSVSIPIEFFTNGWIQVLTDSEIANWLAWRDFADMRDPAKVASDPMIMGGGARMATYDLTRDAWDTHLMLGRVGLLNADAGEAKSIMTSAGQRVRREPHSFTMDDTPLREHALKAITDAVRRTRDAAANLD